MMAVVLDTNIHDEILGTPGMAEDLKSLVAAGKLQILTTHVQRDELAATPDAAKREALLGLPVQAVPVPTGGAISGRSRIGEARIGDGAADGVDIPAIQKGNLQHAEDALIAVTAAREGCVLVTNDGTLARRMRARAATTEVWDFSTFVRGIAELKGHLS